MSWMWSHLPPLFCCHCRWQTWNWIQGFWVGILQWMRGRQILKKNLNCVCFTNLFMSICVYSLPFTKKKKILTSFDFSKVSFFFCGTKNILMKFSTVLVHTMKLVLFKITLDPTAFHCMDKKTNSGYTLKYVFNLIRSSKCERPQTWSGKKS